MKTVSAFAYLYQYYAIPDEFESVEAFLEAAAKQPTVTVLQLSETGCIAPYFIEEETLLTRLHLAEPDRICPIEAKLLIREEYHARLSELVCAKCPGCLRYTPPADGEPLDVTGHDKEMTLDGLCLLRAEGKEPYTLIDAADDFWLALLDAEDSIRKPLFDGELAEADAALSVIYRRFFPCADDVLCVVSCALGQHYLAFGALAPEARLINRFLISRAPAEVTEYWKLFDYLPCGVCRYEPCTGYDLTEKRPTVEFTRLPGRHPRYRLQVFCPPAVPGVRTAIETFRYLCAELGEDLICVCCAELEIQTTDDYADHRPLREFLRAVKAEYGLFSRRKIARAYASPLELVLPPIEKGSRSAAQRMSTVLPGLSFELAGRAFDGRMGRVIDSWSVPVCTLTLTVPADEALRERITARICAEIAADLQRDGLIALIDVARTAEQLYLDFYATAGGETYEALRDLTPEFEGLSPVLTIRDRSGTELRRVNYTFDCLRRIEAQ